jgi:membrane protease YdiL (CAAX protease family)
LADDPSARGGAAPGQGTDGSSSPPPLTAIFYAFLHLTAIMLVFFVGASLVEEVPARVLNLGVAMLVGPLLALYAALVRWAPGEPTMAAVGLVRVPGSAWRATQVLVFASVLGAALAPLASEIAARVLQVVPSVPEAGDAASTRDPLLTLGAVSLAVVLLCVVVLGPMVEEMLYRGFLQARVRMRGATAPGDWRTAFFVAGVYALVQTDPRDCPGALLLAFGFMVARRWGGSTWASVATNVTSQLVPMLLFFALDTKLPAYRMSSEDGLYLPPEVTLACVGAAACSAYALWRLRLPAPGHRVDVVA